MRPQKSSDAKQLQQISNANLLEEAGHSRFVKRSILFLAAVLFIFLIWSMFTNVDEVATSYGDIQPVLDVQTVQHLEGGIVTAVFVKNSEEVKVGQVLMKLNAEQNQAELNKAESREMSLRLDNARLQAFINRVPVEQVNWKEKIKNSQYDSSVHAKKIQELIKEDENLLRQQNNDRASQAKILQEKILQGQAKLQQLQGEKQSAEKQLELFVKQENMYATLSPKGYVSEKDYLDAQHKTLNTRGDIKRITSEIQAAESVVQQSQDELTKLDSTLNKAALQEANQIDQDLLETHHTIERLTDANKRLTITAPIDGIVKGLTALPGTVIAPGDSVMEIVPTQGDMMAQCRVSPRDVGHISVGDPADIKVTSYEFARYGSIKGKVTEISASTFLTKEGQPYYKAKVSLSQNYVGNDPKQNILKPGMTVQVDIITGKKSIMSYFLKPITRALDTAFRER
ncbi:MAG TPA: HlyD family type I secretion periplasmic adaptor subunit [Coxiellaceae bacterium]|nr:MAG: hypothetical protein A3E81_07275 [Gammaproteobacteria bacterium RIFCSPHIGHO2_12_FULL_36_30]HLB57138.1 HlyD family type I secretion periplasmic adaptor subunit [Coxiellaceae bacterium]